MAKKKSQPSSTARHREPPSHQPQSRKQYSTQQTRNRRKIRRSSNRGLWFTVGGVLVAVAAIVGLFTYLSNQSSPNTTNRMYPLTSANPSIVKEITTVNPSFLAEVGTGSGNVPNPPTKLNAAAPLVGPTGKPEVFYEGAEYCPNCAAERWSMIIALSRFGTFHNLSQERSSPTDVDPNTPTFSFYHSSYSSQYIDFVPLEQEGYRGIILETPTTDEQNLINMYNPSQGYPFIDVANRYLFSGASYDPAVLSGQDWQSIAASLSDSQSPIARCILGTANYLTATICESTNQQPALVCKTAPIPQIEQSLEKASRNTSSQNQIPTHFAATRREGDDQLLAILRNLA